MNKDIGRPLFFIILSLVVFGGLGSVAYRELLPMYVTLVIISVPFLILIAISEFFTPKTPHIAPAQNMPIQKKKPILAIIVVVIIIYFVLLGI